MNCANIKNPNAFIHGIGTKYMGIFKDLGHILTKGQPSKEGHIHVNVEELEKIKNKVKDLLD